MITSSTQNSARVSVDRQIPSQALNPQSQTQVLPQSQPQSQPQTQPHHADVTPATPPNLALQLSQGPIRIVSSNSSHEDRPTVISVSSRTLQSDPPVTTGLLSTSPVISQKRTRRENPSPQAQEPDTAVVEREHNASQDVSLETELQPSIRHPRPADAFGPITSISSAHVLASPSCTNSPSAKRRRIEQPQEKIASAEPPSHGELYVRIPSIEINRFVRAPAENAEATTSTDQHATVKQPVKTRKTKLSAKAKGKQRVKQKQCDTVPDVSQNSSGRTSKPRKSRRSTETKGQESVEDSAAQIVANAIQGSSVRKKVIKRKNARAMTPEGAADVRIVPSKVKMSELCQNTNTGKKSTRQTELEELDKAEAARKEQQQLERVMGAAQNSGQSNEPSESADERLERLASAREEVSREVPNTIIVDGQIQIDETSLQLDRHANAAVERDAEQLEGVDESELTRPINAGSWMKREKSGQWNEQLTDMFYEGLRMFGTDFGMISKMFPGRTRRSIKLKFCKEEKLNMQKIKDTLMGATIPVDMEEFSKMSNTVYNDPKELERDLAEDRRRLEEEQATEKQAMDEMRMERDREAAAEAAAVVDDSSAKENQLQGGDGDESVPIKPKNSRNAKGQNKTRRGKKGAFKGRGDVLGPIEET